MNEPILDYESKLSSLVSLLSCQDLDEHETRGIVQTCLQARHDPAATLRERYGADAAKVAQYDAAGVIAFILFIELEDYFAVADTVDELYEQVVDAFEQPALPEYPYDDNDFQSIADFYQWVDEQLLRHHDKYSLIEFGESYTNDFQVVLIHRATVDTTLALCQELGLRAARCA
jgi:hypothetical protein